MENIICQWLCIFAAIFRTNCLQTATEDVTSDTLCVFDIDMVLIQPLDPAFQIPNMQKYESSRYTENLMPSENGRLINQVSRLPSTLVESDAPCIIRRLTYKDALLLGLANTVAKEPNESEKIERLRKLGISFRPIIEKELVLTDLPRMHGSFPAYREGILFTNEISKAKVLVDFLQKSQLCVKRVVYIDDVKRNIQDMEKALKDFDPAIEFTGYLYTGAAEYLSEEISKEQFDRSWQKLIDSIQN